MSCIVESSETHGVEQNLESQTGVQNIEPRMMEESGEHQNMDAHPVESVQVPQAIVAEAVPSVPSHIIPGDPPHAKYDDRYQCK